MVMRSINRQQSVLLCLVGSTLTILLCSQLTTSGHTLTVAKRYQRDPERTQDFYRSVANLTLSLSVSTEDSWQNFTTSEKIPTKITYVKPRDRHLPGTRGTVDDDVIKRQSPREYAQSAMRSTTAFNKRSKEPGGTAQDSNSSAKGIFVSQYCNFPENIKFSAEGLALPGYELVSAHMVLRHGARVPMDVSLSLGPLKFSQVKCRLDPTRSTMPDTLREFISKTDADPPTGTRWRYPLKPIELYCRPAELTPMGVEQQIRIGQLVRQVYAPHLKISQNNLKIHSTRRIRTYQSATAFIFGLLEQEVNYTSLNIAPMSTNSLCRATQKTSCMCNRSTPLWTVGLKQVATSTRNIDPFFDHLNRSVHKVLGEDSKVRSFYPWRMAHAMLASKLCLKQPLTCLQGRCFTESHADASWQSQTLFHQALLYNRNIVKSAQLSMYPFLRELISRLSSQSLRANNVKDTLTVYVGHDNTIIPLLLALGLPVPHWPPFATRLIFELYKPIDTRKDYLFKVIFNGHDMTSQLKFCGEELMATGACALRLLTNYYLNILTKMGHYTYAEACV